MATKETREPWIALARQREVDNEAARASQHPPRP
jgi:hypothetical protein